MNKKRALEILQLELKQMNERNEMTPFFHALCFINEELSKPGRELIEVYSEYKGKNTNIKPYCVTKQIISIPSFTWTCTCCWVKTELSDKTLCDYHYKMWVNSQECGRANYKWLVNIDSPKEVRDWHRIWNIYENKGKCPKCGDTIESLNHYDFQKCSCGHSFIDGGSDYSRRNPDLIDMTIYFNSIWKLPEVTTLEQ